MVTYFGVPLQRKYRILHLVNSILHLFRKPYFGTDVLKWGRIDQWKTNEEHILEEKNISLKSIVLENYKLILILPSEGMKGVLTCHNLLDLLYPKVLDWWVFHLPSHLQSSCRTWNEYSNDIDHTKSKWNSAYLHLHCRDVFSRKGIGGITDEQASFTYSTLERENKKAKVSGSLIHGRTPPLIL